ncbi:Ribonuclease P protein subunit p30 like protein [Argiope bruennichi]|uniref:Ribonuclease P protein subunit p30 like protein n=1 Tax=Argiope bruennichi TaxID=94029 RepID=A0A8T0E064_ARGBR|nr:Ribonuclease P protein subunit p30 like protein [Argiope bruennichi]
MDLNIAVDVYADQQDLIKHVLDRAVEFGFETVALNTIVDSSKLSGKNISIPEPKLIDFKAEGAKHFRVLNRITAVIEESIHSHHFLKSPITKKYDIVALQPVGEKMLQHVCSLTDFDIISLNLTESLGYNLKRTTVGLATDKGICFEITYAPCLRDQTSRRMVISNAQLLVDVLKGRHIFISSGACKPLELRSVLDVINLGLLFGFQKNTAESAVRKLGKLVLKHAHTRNETGCGYVSLTGIHKLPKQQGWIVHACKVPKLSEISSNSQKRTVDQVIYTEEDTANKRVKMENE